MIRWKTAHGCSLAIILWAPESNVADLLKVGNYGEARINNLLAVHSRILVLSRIGITEAEGRNRKRTYQIPLFRSSAFAQYKNPSTVRE